MGRLQALLCAVFLLLLGLNNEVQANSVCKDCPSICNKWGIFKIPCNIFCMEHCMSHPSTKARGTRELQGQKSETIAKWRNIEKLQHKTRKLHSNANVEHSQWADELTNTSANKHNEDDSKQ